MRKAMDRKSWALMTPGQRLKAARDRLRMSQAEFGKLVNLGQVGYGPYERDEGRNLLAKAKLFASALQMDLLVYLQLVKEINDDVAERRLEQWWDEHEPPRPGCGAADRPRYLEQTATSKLAALGMR